MINKNNLKKSYWSPTPRKWRRIGDSLLAVSTTVAIGGLWQFESLKEIFTTTELKFMIILSLLMGVIGKFLTNFFKNEEQSE